MTAPTNPKSISCRCQTNGSNAEGRTKLPEYARIQRTSAITAQLALKKKNGRKPPRRNAGEAAKRARRSASKRSPRVIIQALLRQTPTVKVATDMLRRAIINEYSHSLYDYVEIDGRLRESLAIINRWGMS